MPLQGKTLPDLEVRVLSNDATIHTTPADGTSEGDANAFLKSGITLVLYSFAREHSDTAKAWTSARVRLAHAMAVAAGQLTAQPSSGQAATAASSKKKNKGEPDAELKAANSFLDQCDVAVLGKVNRLLRALILTGMRSQVTAETRMHVYLNDKGQALKALDTEGDERFLALLVCKCGRCLWQARGDYDSQLDTALPQAAVKCDSCGRIHAPSSTTSGDVDEVTDKMKMAFV